MLYYSLCKPIMRIRLNKLSLDSSSTVLEAILLGTEFSIVFQVFFSNLLQF